MVIQSPFSLLQNLLSGPGSQTLPPGLDWAAHELRQRLVLLLNHVLMQESQAMARLAQHRGRVVLLQWRRLQLKLHITPAGLLELAGPEADADLILTLTQESPLQLARSALGGDKPGLRVEGDVQLAADASWLAEHLRWDLEDDLARILGDVPATLLCQAARQLKQALRQFVSLGAGL